MAAFPLCLALDLACCFGGPCLDLGMGIGLTPVLDAADAMGVVSWTRIPTGDTLLGGGGIAPALAALGRPRASGKVALLEAALALGDLNALGGADSDLWAGPSGPTFDLGFGGAA